MTGRFPLTEGVFRPVRESYINLVDRPTTPKCNVIGRNGRNVKETDADLSALCGIFEATCMAHPPR